MALTSVACGGSRRPAPAPTPQTVSPVTNPVPTPPTDAPAPTVAAGRFAYLPGDASYDVRSEATVELTTGPERERGREVVRSSARVGYALSAVGRGFAVAGQVDGYTVEASDRVRAGSDPSAQTVRFNGTLDPRSTRLYADGTPPTCSSPPGAAQIAAMASARETVFWVPAAVTQGARWRDTITVSSCRGPIPATIATTSQYEVIGANGARIQIRRTSTTTLRGSAIVAGRSVTLAGTGTGQATLEIDAIRGRLVQSDDDAHSTVTVTLPDGPRQFDQRVRTEVRARDGG